MTSDQVFVQMTKNILEYLTPKQLGKDLKVSPEQIDQWTKEEDLPQGQNREKLYLDANS